MLEVLVKDLALTESRLLPGHLNKKHHTLIQSDLNLYLCIYQVTMIKLGDNIKKIYLINEYNNICQFKYFSITSRIFHFTDHERYRKLSIHFNLT